MCSWGILRTRTTCKLPLQVVQHLNQRRWWLYKVWAPAKNYNFSMGLKSRQFWPQSERTGSRLIFWCSSLRKIGTSCNFPLQVVKHLKQRRWWADKFWAPYGPIQNYKFPWGSNLHSLDLSQKERYGAQCCGEESCAPEQHVSFRCKSENIRTKEDGGSIKLGS